MITLKDRLQTPLLECNAIGLNKSQKRVTQRDPESVVDWPNFIDQVRRFPLNTGANYAPFQPVDPALFTSSIGIVPSESTFLYFFMRNVLELVLGSLSTRTQCFLHPLIPYDSTDLWIISDQKALIGEGKPFSRKWSRIDNLVQVHAANQANRRRSHFADLVRCDSRHLRILVAIRQLYSYMVDTQQRFGVLTTYNYTWFFARNPEKFRQVWISPRIRITDTDPSVAQCVYYLLQQPEIMPDLATLSAEEVYYVSDVYPDNSFDPGSSDSGNVDGKPQKTKPTRMKNEEVLKDLKDQVDLTDVPQSNCEYFLHATFRPTGEKCTVWLSDGSVHVTKLFEELSSAKKKFHGVVYPRPLVVGCWKGHAAIVFEGWLKPVTDLKGLPQLDKIAILEAYRPLQKSHKMFDDMIAEDIVVDSLMGKYLFLPWSIRTARCKEESAGEADQLRRLLYDDSNMTAKTMTTV